MVSERSDDETILAERWRTLLEYIWKVSADQGRDADAYVHPDFAARTIRAHLASDASGVTSFAVTVSPDQLLEGDLRAIASRFVSAFVAAYDEDWPRRSRRTRREDRPPDDLRAPASPG